MRGVGGMTAGHSLLRQRNGAAAMRRTAAYPTSFDASTFFMYQAMRREMGLRSTMPSTAAGMANAARMPRWIQKSPW